MLLIHELPKSPNRVNIALSDSEHVQEAGTICACVVVEGLSARIGLKWPGIRRQFRTAIPTTTMHHEHRSRENLCISLMHLNISSDDKGKSNSVLAVLHLRL